MRVERLTTASQLDAIHDAWNEMAAGRPFLRYEWLGSWWRHYGTTADNHPAVGEPFVLAVYDSADNRCYRPPVLTQPFRHERVSGAHSTVT